MALLAERHFCHRQDCCKLVAQSVLCYISCQTTYCRHGAGNAGITLPCSMDASPQGKHYHVLNDCTRAQSQVLKHIPITQSKNPSLAQDRRVATASWSITMPRHPCLVKTLRAEWITAHCLSLQHPQGQACRPHFNPPLPLSEQPRWGSQPDLDPHDQLSSQSSLHQLHAHPPKPHHPPAASCLPHPQTMQPPPPAAASGLLHAPGASLTCAATGD